ncbi:ROK family protein [Agromyces sp. ZXT2-6]|uniref:ROK family protein n=1 Tax=Agromyces sp. ZXT2-6 TaxID=3461153 RepID=UPI004054B0ED
MSNAPNLPQVEEPGFLELVRAQSGRPVRADDDANLALLGEQHLGAARDAPTAVIITIGACLGAGIAIDGRILRRARRDRRVRPLHEVYRGLGVDERAFGELPVAVAAPA